MKIEYLHASKFGNGAMVAAEFSRLMAAQGVTVDVHHIRDARPGELPPADLYLFSSPGRIGKPIGGMRRFLKKVALPAGTKYAVLTTEAAPRPDKKTGQLPTDEELARYQRVRPIRGRWRTAGSRRWRRSWPGSRSKSERGARAERGASRPALGRPRADQPALTRRSCAWNESAVVTGWSVTTLVKVVVGRTAGGGLCGVKVTAAPSSWPESLVV
jgi:hypothetical protein